MVRSLRLSVLAGLLALVPTLALAPSAALADYVVKDANGANVTIKSRDVGGGVQAPQFDSVINSTAADRSGTLTTASTAQTLVPANTARRGLAVQNKNAPGSAYSQTTSVFMNCQATATVAGVSSLEIPAGALYETPSQHVGTGACSFISATASTPVYIREY
jgi:hypothetical protein